MADGVAITAGSGTTILTDDTGAGGHAQVVKLAISTDGSGTLIPADATNGIYANVRNIAAGTNYIGKTVVGDGTNDVAVGTAGADAVSNTRNTLATDARLQGYNGTTWDRLRSDSAGALRVNVQKDLVRITTQVPGTTTNGTSYAAGDQVGTIISLANAVRASGGTGAVVGAMIVDGKDIIGAYDLVLFRASVTLASDNAAFSISASDVKSVVALVQLTGAFDLGSGRIAQAQNIYIPFDCSGGTTLYAALITRSAHANSWTNNNAELDIMVHIERN